MTTMHTEDVALFSNPPYNTAEDKISWTQYHSTTFNNIQVSGAGGNYMYKAAIEYLLNYSKIQKKYNYKVLA